MNVRIKTKKVHLLKIITQALRTQGTKPCTSRDLGLISSTYMGKKPQHITKERYTFAIQY